jgi:2-polyprenyl-3-methyl-5-hydroxy-6-metoxy-1,4-benzoquinol methylase
MIWGDIYKQQTARYEFASRLVHGRVLDVTYGSFMAYQAAKILLASNVKEIVGLDVINEDIESYSRKLGIDSNIDFEPIDRKTGFEDGSFDCIISSEVIQHSAAPDQTIREYYRLLKNDGLLIVSTANKDGFASLYNETHNKWDDSVFTKDEFIKLLEKTFPNFTLYSQRILSQTELLEKRFRPLVTASTNIRKLLSKILLKFDKHSNFYQRYLQKKIVKMDSSINKMNQDMLDLNYNLIPFQSFHRPLFLIAVCLKNPILNVQSKMR